MITLGLLDANATDWLAAAIAGMTGFALTWAPHVMAAFLGAALLYLAGSAVIDGFLGLVRGMREYRPEPRHVEKTGRYNVHALAARNTPAEPDTEAIPVVVIPEPRHSTESRTAFMPHVSRTA